MASAVPSPQQVITAPKGKIFVGDGGYFLAVPSKGDPNKINFYEMNEKPRFVGSAAKADVDGANVGDSLGMDIDGIRQNVRVWGDKENDFPKGEDKQNSVAGFAYAMAQGGYRRYAGQFVKHIHNFPDLFESVQHEVPQNAVPKSGVQNTLENVAGNIDHRVHNALKHLVAVDKKTGKVSTGVLSLLAAGGVATFVGLPLMKGLNEAANMLPDDIAGAPVKSIAKFAVGAGLLVAALGLGQSIANVTAELISPDQAGKKARQEAEERKLGPDANPSLRDQEPRVLNRVVNGLFNIFNGGVNEQALAAAAGINSGRAVST